MVGVAAARARTRRRSRRRGRGPDARRASMKRREARGCRAARRRLPAATRTRRGGSRAPRRSAPASRAGLVAQLDLRQAHVAAAAASRSGRRRRRTGAPQPPDRDHDDLHGCDTRAPMSTEPSGGDRHINIQVSPEMMAGVYANFANVSHSDYEFTITFARVDHEVESARDPRHHRLARQPLAALHARADRPRSRTTTRAGRRARASRACPSSRAPPGDLDDEA